MPDEDGGFRPQNNDEEWVTLSAKIPKELKEEIQQAAKDCGLRTSTFVMKMARYALDKLVK